MKEGTELVKIETEVEKIETELVKMGTELVLSSKCSDNRYRLERIFRKYKVPIIGTIASDHVLGRAWGADTVGRVPS